MKRSQKKKYTYLTIGLLSTVFLPLWVNLGLGPAGKLYDKFNKEFLHDSPYLALGVWLIISAGAILLVYLSEENQVVNRSDLQAVRKTALSILRDNCQHRLNQKLAQDITLEISPKLGFTSGKIGFEPVDDHIQQFLIDHLEQIEIRGLDDLFLVFCERIKRMLIIGEAGAGKTVLLLKLVLKLIELAEKDDRCPIPLFYDLITFDVEDFSIEELSAAEKFSRWLKLETIEKLQNLGYGTQQAQEIFTNHHFLPILDGLDEVRVTYFDQGRLLGVMYPYFDDRKYQTIGNYPAAIITCRSEVFRSALHTRDPIPVQGVLAIAPIEDLKAELSRLKVRDPKGAANVLLQECLRYPHLMDLLDTAFYIHIALKLARFNYDFTGIKSQEELLTAYMNKQFSLVRNFSFDQSVSGLSWFAKNSRQLTFSPMKIHSGSLNARFSFLSLKTLLVLPLCVLSGYLATQFSKVHFSNIANINWIALVVGVIAAGFILFSEREFGRRTTFDGRRVKRFLVKFSVIAVVVIGLTLTIVTHYGKQQGYLFSCVMFAGLIAAGAGKHSYFSIYTNKHLRISCLRLVWKAILYGAIAGTVLYCATQILGYGPKSAQDSQPLEILDLHRLFYAQLICIFISLCNHFYSSFFFDHFLTLMILSRQKVMPLRVDAFLNAMLNLGLIEQAGDQYRFRHLLIQEWVASQHNPVRADQVETQWGFRREA